MPMSGMGVSCRMSGCTGEPTSCGVGDGSPEVTGMSLLLPGGKVFSPPCAAEDAGFPCIDGVPMCASLSGSVGEPPERVGGGDVGTSAPVIEPAGLPGRQVGVGAGAGNHGLIDHGRSHPVHHVELGPVPINQHGGAGAGAGRGSAGERRGFVDGLAQNADPPYWSRLRSLFMLTMFATQPTDRDFRNLGPRAACSFFLMVRRPP